MFQVDDQTCSSFMKNLDLNDLSQEGMLEQTGGHFVLCPTPCPSSPLEGCVLSSGECSSRQGS